MVKLIRYIRRKISEDYRSIHLIIGILSAVLFLIGSVFFFYDSLTYAGIWLFVIGSLALIIGQTGNAIVLMEEKRVRKEQDKKINSKIDKKRDLFND